MPVKNMNKATDQVGKTIDKATDKAQGVARQVEDFAGKAVEHGPRGWRNGSRKSPANIKGAVDKSVKDQPMATLAAVAAVGFVLGALWKS